MHNAETSGHILDPKGGSIVVEVLRKARSAPNLFLLIF
jgi:proteasome assembly chaperone (PAC2) family protein